MNRPTTRTEQILASASKGVSSRLILAEAAGFVETEKPSSLDSSKGSSGRLASPRMFASVHFKRMILSAFDCTSSLRLDRESIQSPCNAGFSG